MSIEKSLSQAPQGLTDLIASSEPALEIEIEDPESVKIGMGGLEIEIEPEEETDDDFSANLAEYMNEKDLVELVGDLTDAFNEDVSSRKDWIQTYVDGLELLGMKIEEKTEPWEGACGVYHPILSEALVKFQAETMMSTFPSAGPVKTQIIGKETPEKKDAAERVKDDMNYQLMDVMQEYRPEHERMLWGLGLAGNAFKKVYVDPSLDRQVSMFVPAEDIVVPYGASSIEQAERVTHVMRKTENELRRLQVSGFYRDVDLGTPDNVMDEVEKKIAEKLGFRASSDDRYKLLEMHVDLDLPGYEHKDEDGKVTGIALPYVVTIEKGSSTVLSIRRNWEPDDDTHQKRQHFVHYGYVPGFGFYCFGLIHLVGAFAKSGTSILRQLVDAGSLANLPGGFKARGLRVKGDDTPISPGEFRDVDLPSGVIKDNIMTLPYKEPSQVLAGLLNTIIEEGRRFASAGDMKISDMSAQSPVGTTLAILERTLKVMSAIQARIHYSMKQEFKLLKQIIADYTPEEYSYEPVEGSPRAKKADYDNVEVIPVSDPNAATMAQKIVQYQAVLQLAQQAPQLYNLPLLHRQMLEVLGIKNAAKLIPMQEDQRPADPVTENMDAIRNKPLKAFMYQDHDAHLTSHTSFIQDPATQQMLEQNPMGPAVMAAMQAHMAEHFAFKYRQQIEQQLGAPLPYSEETPDKDREVIPEEYEVQISRMVAQAGAQLLAMNQQQAAQQQAAQQAEDPIIQMQMQELQIKQQEVQRKMQKDQADIALKQEQLDIERDRIIAQEQLEGTKLGAKMAKEKDELERREYMEGTRMGIDMAHKKDQANTQKAQIIAQLMGSKKGKE
jgi:chaperonin GroES